MDSPFGGVERFLVVELEEGQQPTAELRSWGRSLKLRVATKVKGADAYVFCKAAVDQATARRMYDAHINFRRGDTKTLLDLAPGGLANHYIICEEPWSIRYPDEPIPDADPSIPEPTDVGQHGTVSHPFHVIIASPVSDADLATSQGRRMVAEDAAIEGRHVRRATERGLIVLTPVPDTGSTLSAVIATRAPISREEAQRLWAMHERYVDENGGDGLLEYTYELTEPDEIAYEDLPTAPDGTPLANPVVIPVPVGTRFAFVPSHVPLDDPRHRVATDIGLTNRTAVEVDVEEEVSEPDPDERDLMPPMLISPGLRTIGYIYTADPISRYAAERLYDMVHDHGPNSLLERVDDVTEDHFVVHDRTWAERNQGDRVKRIIRRSQDSPEGAPITTRERKGGSMTARVSPAPPQEALLNAAALEAACQRLAYVSAELDAQTAVVWGALQQHVTPAGDPAISMLIKMVEAALEHAGIPSVRWTVRRRGDVIEVSPGVPEDAPDDLYDGLEVLAGACEGSCTLDGCDVTYRWPAEEPEDPQD